MNETTDPSLDVLYEQWDNILMVYGEYAQHRPVMLYDIQESRIYAYPYEDFKAELSEKSQTSLREQYEKALKTNSVVVFIRDNEERKLFSYTLPLGEQKAAKRKKTPASDRKPKRV
jgi:hypothetical protein